MYIYIYMLYIYVYVGVCMFMYIDMKLKCSKCSPMGSCSAPPGPHTGTAKVGGGTYDRRYSVAGWVRSQS